MRRLLFVVLIPAALLCASGCSVRPIENGRLAVPSGEYDRAFAAARQAVIDAGYRLDRIDAAAGVITTEPRPSALLRKEHTVVRIEFVPFESFGRMPSDEAASQINARPAAADRLAGRLVAQVTATRTRGYTPILRPEPLDPRFTTRAGDPMLEARTGSSRIERVVGRDADEEARIAGLIDAALTHGD